MILFEKLKIDFWKVSPIKTFGDKSIEYDRKLLVRYYISTVTLPSKMALRAVIKRIGEKP